jgi:uroporphyrin-III C-methyltransferase
MRWLSQVCEYWPLRRLAGISEADVDELFRAYAATGAVARDTAFNPDPGASTGATASRSRRRGRVILAGSGPGHPDLLTRATFRAMQAADLILADKLVPSGVLDLIPRRTPVRIARKFPGNADAAQQELLDAALAAYREGLTVLRLKQGDPFIYGRGGEEVAFLRGCGVPQDEIVVLPGVTSALSAPLFAGIPPTQRDVADQVLVCTGTGKKGKPPAPPEFVGSRTVVFLMALHRIEGLVRELTTHVELEVNNAGDDDEELAPSSPIKPTRALWPRTTPCAVVERASCPDQRIIRTTLQHVVDAIEAEGSRPPGLLIVGAACQVLHQSEKGRAWVVQDGFRGLDVDDLGIDQIEKLAESSA